jgi:hypothetical protein
VLCLFATWCVLTAHPLLLLPHQKWIKKKWSKIFAKADDLPPKTS